MIFLKISTLVKPLCFFYYRFMKIISWNINGIRAVLKKGFLTWLKHEQPDALLIQETKSKLSQLKPEIAKPEDYFAYWNDAERPGYSGVATFTKIEPDEVIYKVGVKEFDREGRIIIIRYPWFTLFNIYFPNGKMSEERLQYKLRFYDFILNYWDKLREKGEKLIITGDVNTAHKPIDLKNPKQNEKYSGFLPIERAWIDKFLSHGYIDTFRYFHPDSVQYTWWTYRFNARAKNIGWRIDYFFVSNDLIDLIEDSYIMGDVMGSDHCPIALKLKIQP